MSKTANIDGNTVTIGDYVGFKCDVEQSGKIIDIRRSCYGGVELVLYDEDGFQGGYIGGETTTTELASDCWVD